MLLRALSASGVDAGVLGVEYRYMRVLERELLSRAVEHGVAVMGGQRGATVAPL